MGRKIIKGSRVKEFLESPWLKEHNRKIERIGRHFSALSPETRKLCSRALAEQADKNRERQVLIDGELEDEDALDEQMIEEYLELGRNLPKWFPFLASEDEEELDWYAYALMDHRYRQIKKN